MNDELDMTELEDEPWRDVLETVAVFVVVVVLMVALVVML